MHHYALDCLASSIPLSVPLDDQNWVLKLKSIISWIHVANETEDGDPRWEWGYEGSETTPKKYDRVSKRTWLVIQMTPCRNWLACTTVVERVSFILPWTVSPSLSPSAHLLMIKIGPLNSSQPYHESMLQIKLRTLCATWRRHAASRLKGSRNYGKWSMIIYMMMVSKLAAVDS